MHDSGSLDSVTPTSSSPLSALAGLNGRRSAEIQRAFDQAADGASVIRERSCLLDEIVIQLYGQLISEDAGGPKGLCLIAVGGYGRQELFPHSDVDLIFVTRNGRSAGLAGGDSCREAVAVMARTLWDLRLKVGHSVRTLAECGQLQRDNLELSMSLLDCRYLAGDLGLFSDLRGRTIPQLVARDRRDLVSDLVQMTRSRHQKQGETIFHLEPNFKDAPGGLRDYHVCRWLSVIGDLDRTGAWADPAAQWPSALGSASLKAFGFLAAVRCFVHYRQGRDDNVLTYELQDQAAAQGVGCERSGKGDLQAQGQLVDPAQWMRSYFRQARAIHRLTAELVEIASVGPSSLYSMFQDWRSRLSNADFSVVRGRIFPRQPNAGLQNAALLLGLFEMVARHGLELSPDAERWAEQSSVSFIGMTHLWEAFRRILVLPHAPAALRAMHRTGVLTNLFPEFKAIDALVVRDFFHRYTVDEHSFIAIQTLHQLAALRTQTRPNDGSEPWDRRFAEILGELEHPELLFFALLFHDVGKGMPGGDHARGSLQALQAVFTRLGFKPAEREMVEFLIAHHLALSAVMQKRDIFDPDTILEVSERVGTPERLKMLSLLTFADIAAVNPEALTPWKKEMLWRLYASTSNQLTRGLDEHRFHAESAETYEAKAARVLGALAESTPESGPAAFLGDTKHNLEVFLEGFPKRYLESHSPEEIAAHYRMSRQLPEKPVQLLLRGRRNFHELTILTPDRPFLFASLTGVLAAWGMNIQKVDAASNTSGLVLDTFRFVDLYHTLELNADEAGRLEKDIVEVLGGGVKVASLITRRGQSSRARRAKVAIPTHVHFDDTSSSHSTLLELITQDRVGLLYQVSSVLAELGCSIEVALIDTEGEKVVDVFYLTSGGTKLDAREQTNIRESLLRLLEPVSTAGSP